MQNLMANILGGGGQRPRPIGSGAQGGNLVAKVAELEAQLEERDRRIAELEEQLRAAGESPGGDGPGGANWTDGLRKGSGLYKMTHMDEGTGLIPTLMRLGRR